MSVIRKAGGRLLNGVSRMLIQEMQYSKGHGEGKKSITIKHLKEEDLACIYENFFTRDDIDGWDIRQGMTDVLSFDAVPEPVIIIAALHACRRVNDYALSVRWLEAVYDRCGNHAKTIWPYLVQEITPTLKELGCDLPATLCYDKPELWLPIENPHY